MATATLQQLMVINKGSSLPLLIKAKKLCTRYSHLGFMGLYHHFCREICGTHLH